MVSELSVLRPESMDEMEQQIMLEMSEKLEEQKQSTEALKSQIEQLVQSQAKLQAKLIESQKNLETMMPRFFSQTPIPPRPPSQPPDPPDFNKSNLKFDGKLIDGTLLREWVLRCEQFFMLDGTPPEMKVRLASVYLEGEAFEWHRNYINSRYGVYPLWPDYVADLTGRFGEDIEDPLSVLVKVKQDGDSVEKYLARFESALTMVSLPATQTLSIFMANMNPRLALHVRQFAARTVSEAARFARLHESYLHFSPWKQDRAPFSPYTKTQNTSPLNTSPETNMEKSPRKLYCEGIQESGMRGLCVSSDGSYANGHHLEFKKSQGFVVESDDEDSFDVREPSVVTVEEIVDKSVDMIREEKSTPENESSPEVSPQILLSQFQVSLSSLEPSHRYHKESLVVVNDLSTDLGCVIGKTIGCICDSEIGQDNFLDEEELNRVWEPGGVLIEHVKWKGSEKCYELSRVVRLMQGLSSTRWSYGKVVELTQEPQQPKTNLKEIKLKELDRLVMCSSVGCIVALLMVYDAERLIHSDVPPIFNDLLWVKNRIRVRLKMVLLLEFLWLILFTSKMFKNFNVPQNKNQTDQNLSSYLKLLLRLLHPLHINRWRSFYLLVIKPLFKGKEESVSFNIAVTSCSRICFFPFSSWMVSQNRHASSSCALRQEEKYVPLLFTIAEALTLFNDQHTLGAEKNGSETSIGCCYGSHVDLNLMADVTASTSMDELNSVCKLLFGAFVLNLIAEQTRDWSFSGLLLQWKWHPPPNLLQSFIKLTMASLSSLRAKMI